MKQTKEKKKCELTDIQQFLNLSRAIIRQMKFIKKSETEISSEAFDVCKKAAAKVDKQIEKFINEN